MSNPAELFRSLQLVNQPTIDALKSKGVPPLAIPNDGAVDDALRQVRGRCAADGWFDPCEDGPSHVAILAYSSFGDPIDVVCWQSRTDAISRCFGRAFALGAEQISNPGTYTFDQGLLVHSSVLNWLRAMRRGVFIIKPEWAFDELRDAPAVTVEDRKHGYELKKLLQPRRLPKVLVRKQMRETT